MSMEQHGANPITTQTEFQLFLQDHGEGNRFCLSGAHGWLFWLYHANGLVWVQHLSGQWQAYDTAAEAWRIIGTGYTEKWGEEPAYYHV